MSTVTTLLGLTKPAGIEQFNLATYNNNLDLIDTGAINADKQAKGLVYQKIVTGNTGTVVDDIVDNIPSFTFKANRNYEIVWDTSYYGTGNSDSLFYLSSNRAPVGDAANLLTGLTVMEGRTRALNWYSLQGTHHYGPIVMPYSPGAADVTCQIKFRCQRVTGDDGMIFVGNNNERRFYKIYDLGAVPV